MVQLYNCYRETTMFISLVLLGCTMTGCDLIDGLLHLDAPQIVGHHPDTPEPFAVERLAIGFSSPMERADAEEGFSLSTQKGAIAGRFHWDSDNRVLLFTPDSALPRYQAITMQMERGVENAWGNSLERDFQFTFMIGGGTAGLEEPTIVEVVPADGDITPTPRPTIRLRFSEAIRRESLYQALRTDPDIGGRFVWFDEDRELHLVPMRDLQPDTNYRLRLIEPIETVTGRAIDDSLDIGFEVTGSAEPQIASVMLPANGDLPIRMLTDTLQISSETVAFEKDDLIRIVFTAPVPIERRPNLISMSPVTELDYLWMDDFQVCLLRPLPAFEWNRPYELRIADSVYRLRVNGSRSQPPQINGAWFIADIATPDTATPDRLPLSQGTLIELESGNTAALELELSHATDARIDLASLADSLSIVSQQGVFNLIVRDIQTVVSTEHGQTIRFPLTIERPGVPPDIISIRVSDRFYDTRANRSQTHFQVDINGL